MSTLTADRDIVLTDVSFAYSLLHSLRSQQVGKDIRKGYFSRRPRRR